MTIIQKDLFPSLSTLPSDLGSLFGDSLFVRDGKSRAQSENKNAVSWKPALDLVEDSDSYIISIDVPGVPSDEIEVTLEDGVLRIKGSRTTNHDLKEADSQYRRFERVSGTFNRAIRLPNKGISDNVEAVAKDGVLTITIQKAAEIKPKRIAVSA